jgi:hypothetical protein
MASRHRLRQKAGSAGTIGLGVDVLAPKEAPMHVGSLTVDLARNILFMRLTLTTSTATTTLHWSGGWRRPRVRLNSGHVARWFGSEQQDRDRPHMAQYTYQGTLGSHVQF